MAEKKEIELHAYSNLTRPLGITVDEHDDIYIAGNTSNNIHEFSRDGQKHKVILTKYDILEPTSFSFNAGKRLPMILNNSGKSVSIYQKTQFSHDLWY